MINAGHLRSLGSSVTLCLPPPTSHQVSAYHCLYKTVPHGQSCGSEGPIYSLSTANIQENCTGPI